MFTQSQCRHSYRKSCCWPLLLAGCLNCMPLITLTCACRVCNSMIGTFWRMPELHALCYPHLCLQCLWQYGRNVHTQSPCCYLHIKTCCWLLSLAGCLNYTPLVTLTCACGVCGGDDRNVHSQSPCHCSCSQTVVSAAIPCCWPLLLAGCLNYLQLASVALLSTDSQTLPVHTWRRQNIYWQLIDF